MTEETAAEMERRASGGDTQALLQIQTEADRGDPAGQLVMGRLLSAGKAIARDDAAAFAWFMRSAQQGNARAQANVGTFLYHGRGTRKDVAAAIPWWIKAAEADVPLAQGQLGLAYLTGTGVPRDETQGAHWLRRAARHNDPISETALALVYANSAGGRNDGFEANMLLRSAARKAYPPAQTNLALRILRDEAGEDKTTAIALLQQAVGQGHGDAEFQLGEVYRTGKVVKQDKAKACELFARSAAQRHAEATLQLASCQLSSPPTEEEYARANQLVKQAAELGSGAASMLLRLSPKWPQTSPHAAAADSKPKPRTTPPPAPTIGATNYAGLATEQIIFAASAAGDLAEVRKILESGLSVNSADTSPRGDGQTALHHAMRAKETAVAELLLERGAAVNAKAGTGYTALHVASGLGKMSHVALLLKSGADVRAIDARGEPLHAAVVQGRSETVQLLLQAHADPDALTPTGKETPLTLLNSVTFFLPGHNAIVRHLIDAGANVNARNAYGGQPFAAMARADESTAIHLLDKGAVTKGMIIDGKPVSFAFVSSGKLQVVERLLREHSIGEVDRDGNSLLHQAASSEQVKAAAWLLDKELDPNARTKLGDTPLHYAAVRTNDEMLELLLKAGADPNAKGAGGRTPAYGVLAVPNMARYAQKEALRAIRVLHKYGARLTVHDDTGMTPLSWYLRNVPMSAGFEVPQACELAYQVLERAGAAADRNGDTALHSIARRSRFSEMESTVPSLARCLIRMGANPTARNVDNETALDVAIKNREGVGPSLARFLTQPAQ